MSEKKSIHGSCTIEEGPDGTFQCDECGEDWTEEWSG